MFASAESLSLKTGSLCRCAPQQRGSCGGQALPAGHKSQLWRPQPQKSRSLPDKLKKSINLQPSVSVFVLIKEQEMDLNKNICT